MYEHTIIGLLLLGYLIIAAISRYIISPYLPLLYRWIRWLLFSFVLAYFVSMLDVAHKPFWLLVCTAFSLWFVVETAYHWFMINLINKSSIPMFPSFKVVSHKHQWPSNKYFLKIKDQIKDQGFSQLDSLESSISPGVTLKSTVFETNDKLTRLQVLFFPSNGHALLMFFIFTSQTVYDNMYITDNVTIPYGGYYPEGWHIKRKPLMGDFKTLYAIHKKHTQNITLKPWSMDPINHIRFQQSVLHKANKEAGIMHEQSLHESLGKMTSEGCYRVWKELWFLRYLGRSLY